MDSYESRNSPRYRSRSPSIGPDRGSKRYRSSPSADSDWYNGPRGSDRYGGGGYDRRDRRRRTNEHPRNDYSDSRDGFSSRQRYIENPENLFYQVTFRHFADYFKQANPSEADDKDVLDSAWRKYKTSFLHRQFKLFFLEHSGQSWFKEKYDPELADVRAQLKAKGRENKVDSFLKDLESGHIDNVTFDQPLNSNSSAEVAITAKTESEKVENTTNQENEGEEKDENLASHAFPSSTTNDEKDEKSTNIDTEEDKREKLGNNIKDDQQFEDSSGITIEIPPSPNQLFIKSISPEISRKQLEDLCKQVEGFEYLALSEPHPAKKFHRVGWANFSKETDMASAVEKLSEAKVDNFTLHMALCDKPTQQRARSAPGIANSEERLNTDLDQIKRAIAKFEEELGDNRGSEAIEKYLQNAKQEKESSTAESGDKATKDDEMTDESNNNNSAAATEFTKKSLDVYLHYLRNVFHACYYCICICDFPEELNRRCVKHIRRPLSTSTSGGVGSNTTDDRKRVNTRANEPGWAKNLDDKIALWIDKDNIDPKAHGGESKEDATERIADEYIKTEDEDKFRCKTCHKLFKAKNFVVKHISTKHEDILDKEEMTKVQFLNNFALDPSHITPPPMAPPSDAQMGGLNMSNRPGNGNVNYANGAGNMGMGGFNNGGMFGYPNMMFNPYMMNGFAHNPMAGMQMGTMGMGLSMGMRMGIDNGAGAGGNGGADDISSSGRPPSSKRQRRGDFRPNIPPPEGQALDPRAAKGGFNHSYADLDAANVPSGKPEENDLLDLY